MANRTHSLSVPSASSRDELFAKYKIQHHGHLFPVIPRHKIFLLVESGDGKRLVRLFKSTWGRIPLKTRRKLLTHWKAPNIPIFSPQIGLYRELPSNNVARVDRNGHIIGFLAEAMDEMPDDVACDVIAHELAHVVQDAIGLQVNRDVRPSCSGHAQFLLDGRVYSKGALEVDADDRMTRWGFDPFSLERLKISREAENLELEPSSIGAVMGALGRFELTGDRCLVLLKEHEYHEMGLENIAQHEHEGYVLTEISEVWRKSKKDVPSVVEKNGRLRPFD